MSEIKTRADLFEAAAKMMRMCDAAGIDDSYKVKGGLCSGDFQENLPFDWYEFPLAILEGRTVFVGDELWYKKGYKIKISGIDCVSGFMAAGKDGYFSEGSLSWNQPKPKTVMVELPYGLAVSLTEPYSWIDVETLRKASCKALESLK